MGGHSKNSDNEAKGSVLHLSTSLIVTGAGQPCALNSCNLNQNVEQWRTDPFSRLGTAPGNQRNLGNWKNLPQHGMPNLALSSSLNKFTEKNCDASYFSCASG